MMPLSKSRDRERKRQAKKIQPNSNLIIPPAFQPKPAKPFQPSTPRIPGLTMVGNRIIGVQPKADIIPVYNPSIHGPGDVVMMRSPYSRKMIKTTIPSLDAEGQPIPNY